MRSSSGLPRAPAGQSPGRAPDVDEALGGTLADTLAALGATGEAGEVTKIPAIGRLAAPLVAAVGMGATGDGDGPFDAEVLRRAAGAAVRALISSGRPAATTTSASHLRCPPATKPRRKRSPWAPCWAGTRSGATGAKAPRTPASSCWPRPATGPTPFSGQR